MAMGGGSITATVVFEDDEGAPANPEGDVTVWVTDDASFPHATIIHTETLTSGDRSATGTYPYQYTIPRDTHWGPYLRIRMEGVMADGSTQPQCVREEVVWAS